jgi:2-polyprenyl-3-methyl-5-hydroxy-6-metoxy-1,4-benzoquinol methylase
MRPMVRSVNGRTQSVTYPQHVADARVSCASSCLVVRSRYRQMATEHVTVPARASDWAMPATAPELAPTTPPPVTPVFERPRTPVDEGLIAVASAMAPGKALDLGCGEGQNAVWLAERGWLVKAVDMSPGAISEAHDQATAAGVERSILFEVADLAEWSPVSRYDLVFCTFALPARGMGRSRMLDMAAAAVAPGGTILLTEFDSSLHREGWMAEKYLVSVDELERHLSGFRIEQAGVRVARHRHGYEERLLPVANVVATRRTDLRTL